MFIILLTSVNVKESGAVFLFSPIRTIPPLKLVHFVKIYIYKFETWVKYDIIV